MTKKTVIKPAISQKFQEFLKNEWILFFSAPCGFGKTAVAQALLEGRRVWKLEGESARGADLETKKDWDILLMEDFQLFQEEEDQQALCALIRRSPDKRFVILSRGSPPGCLMAFQYAGLMTVIGPKDLLFDREDIRQLFDASGLPVTDRTRPMLYCLMGEMLTVLQLVIALIFAFLSVWPLTFLRGPV